MNRYIVTVTSSVEITAKDYNMAVRTLARVQSTLRNERLDPCVRITHVEAGDITDA